MSFLTAGILWLSLSLAPAPKQDDLLAQLGTQQGAAAKQRLIALGSTAIPALSQAALRGEIAKRLDAIEVLGSESDLHAVLPLVKCLTDSCVAVRHPASDAIDAVLWHFEGDWKKHPGEAPNDLDKIENSLAEISSEDMEPVFWGPERVHFLSDGMSADTRVRANLIVDLTFPMPTEILPDNFLMSRCGTPAPPSWNSPWKFVARHCMPEIVDILENPSSDRCVDVIESMAVLKDRELFLHLDGLCDAANPLIRASAYGAFAYFPGEHGVEMLVKGTHDRCAEVRSRSLDALQLLDDYKAGIEALRLLDDSAPWERDFVANMLGSVKSEKMIDSLVPLLDSDDFRRYEAALSGLASIGSRESLSYVFLIAKDSTKPKRLCAISEMHRIEGQDAEDLVIDCLSDKEAEIVTTACWVLSSKGALRAIPKLKDLAKSPDPKIREAAKQALNTLSGNHRIPPP